jgi:2-(1,2-epoxy-1,2-dihydrophenyl)acetyl-CoA isomerase
MPFDTLLFARRDAVAYVTLNRPERLNALDRHLVDDLTAAAATVAADPTIRAVLLTGAGRAFCSGADLSGDMFQISAEDQTSERIPSGTGLAGTATSFQPPDADRDADRIASVDADRGAAVGASLRGHFNPMISAWHSLGVPVVVAVNGVAAGAGVSLALVGDMVLAARSATFLQLFAPKLGLMPDLGATFHLPRHVGTARAKGLALLGDPLSATDAAAWGLIWSCVDDTALETEAEILVRRLSAGPTRAYQQIKTLFNEQPPATLEAQLEREARSQGELAATSDFAEGLSAFGTRRPPRFTGQ